MNTPAPGWYPDQQGVQRYWDGRQWTEHTAPQAAERAAVSPVLWVAVAAAVVGGVGPWASDSGFTLNGVDTDDGKVVIGISAVALALLLIAAATRQRWPLVLPLLGSGFAAAICIADLSDFQDLGVAAWAIYVAIAGSVAVSVLSLVLLVMPRR